MAAVSAAAAVAVQGFGSRSASAITPLTLDTSAGGAETYTQNFDSVGAGLPTGFGSVISASTASLGTAATFTAAATAFSTTSSGFFNVASADNSTATDSTATQAADTNRAFGLQQTGSTSGYDPGAGFELELANTTNLTNLNLSFNMQELSVQGRATTFSIQFGLGANPTSFTTVGTYTTPQAFGNTAENITASSLAGIANQSQNVLIRVVALTASTGSGNRDKVALDDLTLSYTAPAAGTATGVLTYDPNGAGAPAFTTGTTTADFIDSGTKADVAFANGNTVNFTDAGIGNPNISVDSAGVSPASVTVNNSSGTYTFTGGGIGGPGFLLKQNAGTLVLANSNNFSGGTTISGGTLSISADANLGTGNIALVGGTLQVTSALTSAKAITVTSAGTIDTGANTVAFTGLLSGTGTLTKLGTGALTLNPYDDSIGSLNVSAGSLTLDNANGVSYVTVGNTAANSTITGTLNVGTTSANTIGLEPIANTTLGGTGSIQVAPGSSIVQYLFGTATVAATVGVSSSGVVNTVIGAGTGAASGGPGRALVITGPIVDGPNGAGGITFGGPTTGTLVYTGQVVLTGSNTYTGGTTITAGTVVANSSSGSLGTGAVRVVPFNASVVGVLAGTGAVNAPVTVAGGTITAGSGSTVNDSTGTLTLTQPVALNTGKYVVKLNGTTNAADELVVSGLSFGSTAFTVALQNVSGGSTTLTAGTTYLLLRDTNTTQVGVFNGSTGTAFAFSAGAFTSTDGNPLTLSEVDSPSGETLVLTAGTATPEPTSITLLGTASATLVVGGRRRRRDRIAT